MKGKWSYRRDLFASIVVMVGMWSWMVYGADEINKQTSFVNVGVVLGLKSWAGKMGLSCINISLSDFYSSNSQYNTKIQLHITDSKDDLLLAASQALELIEKNEVEAILGPESSFQAPYIIQLGEKYEVPLLSFAPPPPASTFSNLESPYLFRAYNHFSQIYAICNIIKAFQWNQVVTIYQDDEFGKWLVLDLIQALQEEEIYTHVYGIDPAASGDQIKKELERLSGKEQATIFIAHMVHSLASRVFEMANEIRMMSKGYAWILTDATASALNSMHYSTLRSMQGVLGVKTYVPKTMRLDNFTIRWRNKFLQDNPDIIGYYPNPEVFGLWAYDATWALAIAAESNFVSGIAQNGTTIMESLSMVSFKGLSGEFSLGKGQQNLKIVNVIGDGDISTVGYWTPEMKLTGEFNRNVTLRPIIWPGYSIQPPKGWIPFNPRKVLKIGVPLKSTFMPSLVSNDGNITGYCLDIFKAAVRKLPYTFPLHLYIPFEGSYDDLIVAVYRREFDAAVGDITILANRSSFVDFTLPFTDPGIAVIVPVRYDLVDHGWLFLKPLTLKLWITSFCFFVFMGFVVWILEHQNTEEFRRGPLYQQIGTSLCFSFSIIVFAQREKLTSNLSRFVVVIWFFVVFVLTQSYTASLTSWLTVQQLQPVTDMNQIMKRNCRVGYQNGSFVYDTLKFLGIQNLVPYTTLQELHELFTKGGRKGGVDVAIDEIPYMKLLLATYSGNYTMGDSQYKSGGFGFAFTLGSSLVDDISKAVLKVTQSDEMNQIDERWFGKKISHQSDSSDGSDASSSSLDLTYFRNLFFITTFAVIFALTLYFFRHSDSPTIWTRIIAAIYRINVTKDDGRIDNVESSVPAEVAEEASLSTDTKLPSPSTV
ncbi:glutamate receptor 2.9-like [Benincasa hispida]|uniref:glutamate receptor 2.9-like n=1 Tax=Benincasa hispida TaxID=102211 RepID=UPI0018FFDA8C|nr:glutamate receptor 2.9-like [Benincasa hispida]